MKKALSILLVLLGMISVDLSGEEATPEGGNSGTGSRINVDIDDKTEKIRVINTDNDPKLVTKTYVLKHADPYEIREILRSAVSATRITGARASVEAVKYNDGTGAVIVTAEDYRFRKDNATGQTIDDIVKMLDRPAVQIERGGEDLVYRPEYRSASALALIIERIGLEMEDDPSELDAGGGKVYVDSESNTLIVHGPPSAIERVRKMLAIHDKAPPQRRIEVKLYRISYGTEKAMGTRFQEWKNGPGSELFAAGAKYSTGPGEKAGMQFVKLSPVWKSEFLDFLVQSETADRICSGIVVLANRQTGVIHGEGLFVKLKPNFAEKTADISVQVARGVPSRPDGILATTRVQALAGQTVIVGVHEKSGKRKVESGVPVLKDIPLVGSIFGSTTERPFVYRIILYLKSDF